MEKGLEYIERPGINREMNEINREVPEIYREKCLVKI